MLILLALAAAAATPLPLDTVEAADIRCVVTAAIARPPQAPVWLATRARELLVLAGADIMDRTGRTREQIVGLIDAEVARQKAAPADAGQIGGCAAHVDQRMRAEAAADPLPLPLPQR